MQFMKIIIPGGTGQVGTLLARAFTNDGHEVVVISRKHEAADWAVVSWDAETLGEWAEEIDGADVVINLAGRNVNCRYNEANCREIMDSRVNSTRVVGEAISKASNPPKVWLQASTATIYSHRFDASNDEKTGIIGGSEPDAPEKWRFSIEVAKAWEQAANEADTPNTRKVLMRSAIVLSPDQDGIFDVLLGLVRRGLGGTAADGNQYISWVHERDFVNSVNWLIEHEELFGPVNIASPNPMINKDFMRILRDAWGASIGLPATRPMLALAAVFMQTETELILKSRRVVPTKLLDSGFNFSFPLWEQAARDLCRRWRKRQQ
jgi:TIGR01777 family protein